jgi:aldose 1-epimerase
MTASAPLELSAGRLRLQLRPDIGGGISGFTCTDGQEELPVLRASPAEPTDILQLGSFPLVPWVNRVRGGGFEFRGRQIRLTPDLHRDPSPLHGHGWLNAWEVESADATQAVLTYRFTGGEWPWPYLARQSFSIYENGLSIRLSCTNESDQPMPCGLGHHPYFACGAETRLDTKVDCTWTIDELVLPVEKAPAEGRFSMSNRAVCGQGLDHGFGGWGGSTRISDPAWPFRIEFSSPTARFFQLYSPPEGGFFVAEPVTHANTAMNAPEEEWPELGMEVLEPGQTMVLDTRFDVIAV